MIVNWNIDEVKAQVDKISWSESDSRMDGFVTFGCKKDLLELYWYIEDKINNCSTYVGEKDLYESRREQKIIKKLKG
jgi:hypothetical protein